MLSMRTWHDHLVETRCGVPPGASYSSRRPHGALWALFSLWSAVLPALRSRSRRQEFGSRLRSCIWGGRPRREDPPARKRPASLPCTPCVPQSLPCRPFSHVEHPLAHFWQRNERLRTSAGHMLTASPSNWIRGILTDTRCACVTAGATRPPREGAAGWSRGCPRAILALHERWHPDK